MKPHINYNNAPREADPRAVRMIKPLSKLRTRVRIAVTWEKGRTAIWLEAIRHLNDSGWHILSWLARANHPPPLNQLHPGTLHESFTYRIKEIMLEKT